MTGRGGLVTKSCLTLMTPWTVAHQAPLSMGFFRQEYWSWVVISFSNILDIQTLFYFSVAGPYL